eukprot:GAHX01002546.1.p2 GENE.GAHX01002546.1~~GAHX01002546.1.p2  ORF type:complete len:57 (-),score=4.68 GAHX01002546.1:1023-1193(-)
MEYIKLCLITKKRLEDAVQYLILIPIQNSYLIDLKQQNKKTLDHPLLFCNQRTSFD